MLGKIEGKRRRGQQRMRWHHWCSGHNRANSGRWRGTGRPGVLQFMVSWRVGHNCATEQQQQYTPWIFSVWITNTKSNIGAFFFLLFFFVSVLFYLYVFHYPLLVLQFWDIVYFRSRSRWFLCYVIGKENDNDQPWKSIQSKKKIVLVVTMWCDMYGIKKWKLLIHTSESLTDVSTSPSVHTQSSLPLFLLFIQLLLPSIVLGPQVLILEISLMS